MLSFDLQTALTNVLSLMFYGTLKLNTQIILIIPYHQNLCCCFFLFFFLLHFVQCQHHILKIITVSQKGTCLSFLLVISYIQIL